MRTLTLWILRHKRLVGLGWVVVAIFGMASAAAWRTTLLPQHQHCHLTRFRS